MSTRPSVAKIGYGKTPPGLLRPRQRSGSRDPAVYDDAENFTLLHLFSAGFRAWGLFPSEFPRFRADISVHANARMRVQFVDPYRFKADVQLLVRVASHSRREWWCERSSDSARTARGDGRCPVSAATIGLSESSSRAALVEVFSFRDRFCCEFDDEEAQRCWMDARLPSLGGGRMSFRGFQSFPWRRYPL